MTRNEIDIAIQRAFDGTLSDAECMELRAILKSDPSARTLYCKHAGLHQALIYRLSHSAAVGNAKSMLAARQLSQNRLRARILMAAAAAVILCAVLALKLSSRQSIATYQGAPGSRFTVGNSYDAQVGIVSGKLEQGCSVNLTQGALEVMIRNGSRAIVLAPAAFNLQSDRRIFLEQGTAWIRVGKRGHGFQIATPQMLVTDFGTEFGVISHPGGGAEVHVFSGQVEYGGLDSDDPREKLATGQARSCEAGGAGRGIEVRPSDFLTALPVESSTGVISNGDFEAGNKPGDALFGSVASAALLPSWKFGKGIALGLRDNTGRLGYGEKGVTVTSPTADVQLAFRDDTVGKPSAEAVSISQCFATVPGCEYVVEFGMGGFFFRRDIILEITATTRDGKDPATGSILGQRVEQRSPSAGNGYNAPCSFTFTAASNTTTLVFTETSPNSDDADPVIDNVSVRGAK